MEKKIPQALVSLFALGLVASCGYNTQNSVSSDAERYSPTPVATRFEKARAVMRKNCVSCHTTLGTLSETEMTTTRSGNVGDFLLVPGQLDQSALWRVLRGGGATAYMPPDYTLTADEIATMRDWIANVGKPERGRPGPPRGHH